MWFLIGGIILMIFIVITIIVALYLDYSKMKKFPPNIIA
jgi:hypothetical protein